MTIIDKIVEDSDDISIDLGKAKKVYDYLLKYGYIKVVGSDITVNINQFKEAIAQIQRGFGITVDGTLNLKTLAAMEWPRCGVKEHLVEEASERLIKWGSNKLTYAFSGKDTDLTPAQWDACARQSFDSISAVCGLQFTQVFSVNQANLVIGLGRGASSDFDGPSGTLAWFQLPPSLNYSGQLSGKLDADENWVYGTNSRGILALNVLTHELLHGLGLVHSNVSSALMAPFYSPNISKPQLNDDIPRLQARYGPPLVVPVPTPTPTPTPAPTPTGLSVITFEGRPESITIPGYRVNIQKLS
jgi:matrix metalloproteinase-14 (membrane-inserted)